MPVNRKPRCFVAMAFDHDDTDAIYERAIKLVLTRNNVNPIIINRREDNRDINHQIIDQLDRADFCIVDLTYTRPSVYFEAGYAQRNVEVIYTVRADHLKKNQPEHLRVHFDLQMKPIIKWNNPSDQAFIKRLERRLSQTVLSKWKAMSKQDEIDKNAKQTFLALSTNSKLSILRRLAILSLHRKGFREWCINLQNPPYSLLRKWGLYGPQKQIPKVFKRPDHLSELDAIFVARQINKNQLLVSSVYVSESVTMKCLRDDLASCLLYSWEPIHFHVGFNDKIREKILTSEEHHIIVSLNNIPISRIMKALPNLSFQSENNRYSMNAIYSKSTFYGEEPKHKIVRQVYFYFIANTTSEPTFKSAFEKVVCQVDKTQE